MEADIKDVIKKKVSIQVNLVCNTVVSLWVLDAKPNQNKTKQEQQQQKNPAGAGNVTARE